MKVLEGIRVLDLSQFLSGPRAAQLLAFFGADVIKVEPPSGDTMRLLLTLSGSERTLSCLHQDKRSIVIDLRKQEGRDVFLELADESDVIVENFKPGTMEKIRPWLGCPSDPKSATCLCSDFRFWTLRSFIRPNRFRHHLPGHRRHHVWEWNPGQAAGCFFRRPCHGSPLCIGNNACPVFQRTHRGWAIGGYVHAGRDVLSQFLGIFPKKPPDRPKKKSPEFSVEIWCIYYRTTNTPCPFGILIKPRMVM